MSRFMNGLAWSGLEKFLSQGISFLIGLIIARKLYPEDYGLFGIILVIISISAIFVDSGFSTALIQKKNRDDNDYNTIFTFNLFFSIAVYFFIFVISPYLSDFFSEPKLILTTRIASITILINALSLVHYSRLIINLDFKSQSKISIISSFISGLVGMYLAYNGYGIWSLIIMIVSRSTINTILLWTHNKWLPKLDFKVERFKPLFEFSSKIMITALINTIFTNIYIVVIGKKFSGSLLGYYTRATQITNFSVINFTEIIQRVSFPILSEIQEEKHELVEKHKRLIKCTSYLIFPILTILFFLSESLIELVLTKKWIEAVWMVKLLCIANLFHPIHSLNLNLLNVIGRSDLLLKIEILKKILIVLILIATIPLGLKYVIIGQIIISFFALIINAYYIGIELGYKLLHQLNDMYLNILATAILAIFLFYISQRIDSHILEIFLLSTSAFILYFLLSLLFKLEGFYFIRAKLIYLFKRK